MSNRTEYNFNEKVKIDKFIGGDYYDHRSLSKEDLSDLKKCVTETGITKDDLNAFGNAIYEILEEGIHSQNDILNELVKLSLNFEESRKTGFTKNLQEKVSLTNGMISIGKTAAGLISQNPTLTVSGVIDAAKEFAK